MKVLLAPSLNGLHRLKLLCVGSSSGHYHALDVLSFSLGAACITKLSIQLLGSCDLARGFSASDLSCTSEVLLLTCGKHRVVELMRIPRLRRISWCSTVLLSDLNKGFLLASLFAFIGNTAGNCLDPVKELHLRSFNISCDCRCFTAAQLILGSSCVNSSVFSIFQMVVACLCITTEMSSLLAQSTLPWHCMAVSVKERFLGSSAGGDFVCAHRHVYRLSMVCTWATPAVTCTF